MTHPAPLTRGVQAALDMAADAAESCGHCEDIFLAATAIRAIPVAEVLAKVGAERCAKCHHPRSNHPYRHPFVSMGDTR